MTIRAFNTFSAFDALAGTNGPVQVAARAPMTGTRPADRVANAHALAMRCAPR